MLDLQISRLHAAYANGAGAEATVAAVFQRIAEVGDAGIFITLRNRADVEADAQALGTFDPARKPLWGVPFAVKDNIDVEGLPTTAGCPAFTYTPAATAFAVQKLLDAGALLIGKTNLDQFATGLVGVRTPYPVPKNAIRPGLIPGGSSSGSAAATAHGMVTFALGTDTAGSGRVPAALNNIVGLKPSVGAVPASGVVPACRTLDCISVFALNVEDAFSAFTVMAQYDATDAYSLKYAPVAMSAPRRVRAGIPNLKTREFFGDRAMEAAYDRALDDLAGAGFDLVEFDYSPFREAAELLYGGPWVAERYQAIREFLELSPEAIYPVTRSIIEGARRFTAADAFAGIYTLAGLVRQTETVWSGVDVLALPSIPATYTVEDVQRDPVGPNLRLGTYTNFVNMMKLAAIAVPGRFTDNGNPSGITLVGPRGTDGTLAALARRFHATVSGKAGATGFTPSYGRELTGYPEGYLQIAVVGAHLSGMPLDFQLRELDAVFVRDAMTAADYKLYELATSVPPKPGLLRVKQGGGTEIACEIWALSPAGFGRFVEQIPSPLGIGKLKLNDGTAVSGFLVENVDVHDAKDISSYGGWRAYRLSSP